MEDLIVYLCETEKKIKKAGENVNPHIFFDKLNENDKDYLNKDDFRSYFLKKNYYVLNEDLKFLLSRFDCNKDGLVSYHEFLAHFFYK